MSVLSFLDCGCAINQDGSRTWCPTCEGKIGNREDMNTLLMANIEGSVCEPENYKWLEIARHSLKVIKEQKLIARHKKNNELRHQGTAYAPNVFNHIIEETEELKGALANNDFDNALEEIADIVNCAEILGAILIKNKDAQ